MYKEILLTLDGSPLAEVAIPHACAIAKAFDARIILLSVVESIKLYPTPSMMGTPMVPVADQQKDMENMRGYIDGIAERMNADGIRTKKIVREGDAASRICDFTQDGSADLIVMSTHGLSGIRRWVYGSVADRVLRGADVPILLVRAEFDE